MDKKKYTRKDLFDLVWSVTQKEAAEVLGIEKWHLPHLCERHNVPRPESGYWTKQRLGRAEPRPDLPPSDHGDAVIHEVRPPKPDLLDPEFLARADALLAREKDPDMAVEVMEDLTSPHPLVAKAREGLAKSKPDYTGALEVGGAFGLRATPGQVDRALLLMETLARACDKRGYLVGPKREAHLEILGGRAWVQIREKLLQKDNPEFRTNKWGYSEGYRHVFEPTGALILRVEHLRMTDAAGRPIESRMQEAMALLVRAALDSRRKSLEDAERQKRWELERIEEQRREQEIAEKRQHLKDLKDEEKRRVEDLGRQVEGWVRSRQMREYAEAVRALLIERDGKITEGGEAEKWLKWALEQADRADPLRPSPYSILDEPEPGWRL